MSNSLYKTETALFSPPNPFEGVTTDLMPLTHTFIKLKSRAYPIGFSLRVCLNVFSYFFESVFLRLDSPVIPLFLWHCAILWRTLVVFINNMFYK